MFNPFRFFATGKDIPEIQDKNVIDKLYKKYRLNVMLAITVGYGLAYPLRLALNVVKKPLIDNGIFTAMDLGNIGSALLYAYALGKLTNGFLADHANVKRFFTFGVIISALLNIAMGGSTILWVWIILWGLNGWFQGFGAPTGAVSLANWFSNKERGFMYGIWSTAHALGEGLTFLVSATIVSFWGWQAGFVGPGLFGLVVAFGIYMVLQDRPQTLGLPVVANWKNDHVEADKKTMETKKAQLQILKMPAIWVLGIASATMYMTRYAINSWGILYLQEAKGYTLIESGAILSLNTFAGIIGCVAYGYISDKFFSARRPPVTLFFGIIEILALFVIFYSPPGNIVILTSAFFVYGFMLSGLLAVLGGLFAIDISPRNAAGAAMGFIGVFSYIGAGLQEQISGFLIDTNSTAVNGVLTYNFNPVIIYWIGSSVVSMILAATLWRVKVKD
ncbi:MAG: MFS transporter [Candidatus Marinimicrobia bacterium]|nr:MFS transporter [Candidatus Neomarinimicrobiota bacterium]